MVATFIDQLLSTSALDTHIYSVLQPAYAARYHSMMSAINKYLLPLGLTMPQPNRDVVGGYFIWLTLPKPLLAEEIARRALAESVIIAEGSLFTVQGDPNGEKGSFERDFRLCFSWEEEASLKEGIERLGRVIRRSM